MVFFIEYNYSLPIEEKTLEVEEVQFGYKIYIASFRHNGTHLCTGILVSEKHVLTAAQCLNEFFIHEQIPSFKEYSILLEDVDKLTTTLHSIEQVEVHSRYIPNDPTSFLYDIGVITVS